MDRIRAASFAALFTITLTSLASAQRQEIAVVSPDSALDSNIVARDSTRAVVAEVAGHVQLDQARVDSLQVALATARAATPPDTATMRRATAALKETKDTLNRDLSRSRRERARLAAIEKRLGKESDPERDRSTISALPSTAPSWETGRVASTP